MSYIANYPVNASTIAVSATSTASAAVAIPGQGSSIRISNEGPNNAYIAVGMADVAATVPTGTGTTTCTPIFAGADVIFTKTAATDGYISAITQAGQTARLNVSSGEGS